MEKSRLTKNPPAKVLAMYQAVIDLINEGCDVNTLKVADITGRAGIGKGTAYEYFSSKEEILSSSILYYVKECFGKLQEISLDSGSFYEKVNEVMDFIDEHVKQKQGVFFLIKMVLDSYEIPKTLQQEYERMKQECCEEEKNQIIDRIVAKGVEEGLIKEQNLFLQRAAMETQLSVYFMYCIAAEKRIETDLEVGMLREYIYRNLLKLLG